MQRNTRMIVSAVLALAMIFSLTACGQSSAAKAADALIAAIGEVGLESGDAITAAEEAVAALEEKDRESLDNLESLTQAREAFNEAVDLDKIGAVESLISEIGEVTRESGKAIDSARTAFNALEQRLQARITNADVLAAAEEQYVIAMCRISVLGAFYKKDQDGNGSLYIVFDYLNDAEARTMPEKSDEVTLETADGICHALGNEVHYILSGRDSYSYKDYGYFERYSGFKYAVGAGEINGYADTVRMFVCFSIKQPDLEISKELSFTYDGQNALFRASDVKEISIIDEIMTVDENYEKRHEERQLLWRLDKAYKLTYFINEHWSQYDAPGYDGLSAILLSLFNDSVDGVSLNEDPSGGFFIIDGKRAAFHPVQSLPGFNMTSAGMDFPKDVQESILKYQLALIILAGKITDSTATTTQIAYLIAEVYTQYENVCNLLGIEKIHEYLNLVRN